MHYHVVEIGVCDFDILSERYEGESCILVEPHPVFYEKLLRRNNPNWIIVKAAISNTRGKLPLFHVDLVDIETRGIDWCIRGCSSLSAPGWFMKDCCRNAGGEELIQKIDVDVMTIEDLLRIYSVTSITHLKIDAEGQDQNIMRDYVDLVRKSPGLMAEDIDFENSWFDSQESLHALEHELEKLGYEISWEECKTLARLAVRPS